MDFIFDQFVELETESGSVYVPMGAITCVEPEAVDKCNVYCAGFGSIYNVKMPAQDLVQKIDQRRLESQRWLCIFLGGKR